MDRITEEDVDKLISLDLAPSLSLLMPTEPIAGEAVEKMKIRYKNLLRKSARELEEIWEFTDKEKQDFLDPLEDFLNNRDFWLNQSQGLALFRNKHVFEYYRLPLKFNSTVHLEKYFYISPLIPEFFSEKHFYLLAISRKSCRIFEGTPQEIEELEIEDLPQGVDDVIGDEDRQSSTQQHSAARGGKSVIHHGHEDRAQKESGELQRYLKEVDRAISPAIKDGETPVLIMCVKELFPNIKKTMNIPHMMDEFIHGSPDKLSSRELLEKASDIMKPYFKRPHKKISRKYQELEGSEKTSSRLEDIVPASYQGRVDSLIVHGEEKYYGVFKPQKDKLEKNISPPQGYDLFNFAALNTVRTDGKVFLMEKDEMPVESSICAIYRY